MVDGVAAEVFDLREACGVQAGGEVLWQEEELERFSCHGDAGGE